MSGSTSTSLSGSCAALSQIDSAEMLGESLNQIIFWKGNIVNQPFDTQDFIQTAGDAIVAAGPDGTVVLWNRAAERIFGYTEQEALGHSLDLIIPERLRNRHWEGYRKVMQTGETRYGTDILRVPAAHKDGRRLSIAFTVALLYSPEREVQAIVAIIRDETSRWEEERALRQRIAELEAKNR
jgi:PAS domain S-box-containing protein